jgi:hypothetical protein
MRFPSELNVSIAALAAILTIPVSASYRRRDNTHQPRGGGSRRHGYRPGRRPDDYRGRRHGQWRGH